METLLNNPAFQGGVLPFIVALVAAVILRPLGRYSAGLAVAAGVCATMVIIKLGFVFPPRSSTHKIVILALASLPLAAVLNLRPWSARLLAPAPAIAGAGAVLWLVWPVLARSEGASFWLMAGGAALYGAWLCAAFDSLHDKPAPALGAALALGFGTGGAALLGASAKFGQLGLALGAASAAVVLLHLITNREQTGRMLTFPVALLGALLGYAAMVYAKLPWYALPLLALIPLLAQIPLPAGLYARVRLIIVCAITCIAAAAAVFLTWRAEGGVPV